MSIPKRGWSILVAAFVALACGACAPLPPLRTAAFPLRDLRFPSGLRVLVEEDKRAPLVAVAMLVGAGSTSDPPGKEGLAHVVEHLAFRARPDGTMSLSNLASRAGAGASNAATTFDATVFWEVGPKEALPAFLLLESARLLGPVANVTDDTAKVELSVVQNELRQRSETGLVGSAIGPMQRAMFPASHPYARPVGGAAEGVAALTLDDAKQFAKAHYRPDNVTMVIVGDVDLATVGDIVERALPDQLKRGTGAAHAPRMPPNAPPAPVSPKQASLTKIEAAVASPELWIGWTLPRAFDAEGFLDQFLSSALGRVLPIAMQSDTDIIDVRVRLEAGKDASMLLCRVTLREGAHPERSLEKVLDQVILVWNTGRNLTSMAQRRAVTAMLLDADDIAERAVDRAASTHFSGDPRMFSKSLQALSSIQVDQVTAFAEKYATRDRARAVLLMPAAGAVVSRVAGEGEAPRDEPPPPLDDAAIERFVHAPGASSYRALKLDNGVELIVGRREGRPIVTVGLSLHGGSAAASVRGADRLAAMLAVPKTTLHASPEQDGFYLGSAYREDEVRYVAEGGSGNVANMLRIIADWAPKMRVTQPPVAELRRFGLAGLQRVEQRPEAVAHRAFQEALFGEHPYGRTTVHADLVKVGDGDANDFTDTITAARNAVVAVVGDIDPDAIVKLAQETFGEWSSDGLAIRPPPPPALPEARAAQPMLLVTDRRGVSQAKIRLGCLLPDDGAGARHAVLASIVGGRLYARLRVALGASYGFHARAHTLRGGAAYLTVEGAVEDAKLNKAFAEIKRALAAPIADTDVARAKWDVARSFGVSLRTNASIVDAILRARNEGRPLASIDGFKGNLLALGVEDVARDFAQCTRAPVLSVVGDESTVRSAATPVWR